MLDFIYYPVSAILWFWHTAFGALLGPDSGFAWALAVVFLVFTVRIFLLRIVIEQLRTARQIRELQPRIKALRKTYAGDRMRQAIEMRKLQKDHGFNPWMGYLPILVQAPVFLGLYHVLRSFNRTGTGWGQLGMSPEANAATPNYVFSATGVQSFLTARLFGAPISAAITTPDSMLASFASFGGVPTTGAIAAVAIPLMLIAGLATHFNARASLAGQNPGAVQDSRVAMMKQVMLWVLPLGVLAGGSFLAIAILLYLVSNSVWTYGQQHIISVRTNREKALPATSAVDRRAATAPRPGARPVNSEKPAGGRKRRGKTR
ncbi:membrane protein insertase YidC [Nocardia amamiensis]|uniref:membrane protein insertase YidC n=1 Tax=Nocardia amamiensis TaxID=404578 RepID=UPI0008350C44|nr:membrane protein insertase YidC [Nocardia amamiensis]